MTPTTVLLRTASCVAAMLFSAALAASTTTGPIAQTEVFQSGTGGYAIYRIPAIVPTTSGTLLAFAEGRKNSASDTGRIDLLLRRSSDAGNTWGPIQVVWSDGANTCGNPAPVVDASTGRIWLLSTWNLATDTEDMVHDGVSSSTRRIFTMHSDNDGLTWSPPDEITSSVKRPNWRWYATGPCHGIQLRDGRLVIPGNHSTPNGKKALTSSHAIISDDHGATWHVSQPVGGHTNESTVAELDDGGLYINMRSYRGLKQRATAWSRDRGETWSEPSNEPALIEPVCQGSLLRYQVAGRPSLYLFSNPASAKREKMTVRLSHDGCRTWTSGTLIHAARSAYSDLCPLPNSRVGLLYERDSTLTTTSCIAFARIPLGVLFADSESKDTTLPERTQTMPPPAIRTRNLPPIPDPNGFASPFAGKVHGAILVAGGANFPDKKPWEGGKKVWHDKVFMLNDGATTWKMAGQLPRPIAYGVSISTDAGVLCIGGEDAQQTYADVFLMERDGDRVTSSPLPPLPAPCANACGVLVGTQVYAMGGTSRPGATAAGKNVYVLDLANMTAGWREIETWPGPPRMLATAAACQGRVYLFGGVDLHAGPDGKPVRTYLNDAYCHEPGKGWKQIADMPRPAVAAPSPAPLVPPGLFCVIGGDDGKLAKTPPGPDHPGFPRSALWYEPAADRWTEQPTAFQSQVTLPVVPNGDAWILPNGEIRPGVRTPEVIEVQFSKEQ